MVVAHHRVLGEAAPRPAEPHDRHGVAALLEAGRARLAFAAEDLRHDRDAVARPRRSHAGPDGLHDAGELVPEDLRQPGAGPRMRLSQVWTGPCRYSCRSVPQIPHSRTRTSSSPGPGPRARRPPRRGRRRPCRSAQPSCGRRRLLGILTIPLRRGVGCGSRGGVEALTSISVARQARRNGENFTRPFDKTNHTGLRCRERCEIDPTDTAWRWTRRGGVPGERRGPVSEDHEERDSHDPEGSVPCAPRRSRRPPSPPLLLPACGTELRRIDSGGGAAPQRGRVAEHERQAAEGDRRDARRAERSRSGTRCRRASRTPAPTSTSRRTTSRCRARSIRARRRA